MNNWFYLALIAPILWTIVNHIDKYLLSKVFRTNAIGPIFLFSGFFSIFVAIFIFLFHGLSVFHLPLRDILTLLLAGSFNALAFYFYLYALKDEEASVVVPLLQLTPVFTYLLGCIFLGEFLNLNQIFASVVILSGILMISIDFDVDNNFKLKHRIIILMSCSSLFFAFHDVVFKFVAIKNSFTYSTFWQYIGIFFVSLTTYIFSSKHRNEFLEVFRLNKFSIFYLNVVSEVLYVAGNLASNFTSLLVPVVLVSIISSYQPLFVFLSSVLLTLFFPKISNEKISIKHFFQKSISIGIIIIGSYMLYLSSN